MSQKRMKQIRKKMKEEGFDWRVDTEEYKNRKNALHKKEK